MRASDGSEITVFEPNQRARTGLLCSLGIVIRNVVNSRGLIWQLFKRDFVSSYKQSFLGLFWLIVSPLLAIVSWVFMSYAGILNPGQLDVPYPVYVLVGSLCWGLFMAFYSASAAGLSAGGNLILQANFAHEALVAQQMTQAAVTLVGNIATVIVVLLVSGISPSGWSVLFPLTLVPLFCLGSAIGMVVSVLSVVVHDVTKMVTALLGLVMFITPVIYTARFDNLVLQNIIWWNPLTYLVSGARDIVLRGKIDYLTGYSLSTALSIFVFIIAWRVFFLSEKRVAEKL